MATTITSECINCGACEPECPNTAIYAGGVPWELNGTPGAAIAQDIYYIVPSKCTECVGFHDHEACAAVCPVDCCIPDPANLETEGVLLAPAAAAPPPKPAAPAPTAAPVAAAGLAMMNLPKDIGALPGPVEEKHFPGEIETDFDTVLASVDATPVRTAPTAMRIVLRFLEPVLGAMPDDVKAQLEEAVGTTSGFSRVRSTALNMILNLILYPVLLTAFGVLVRGDGLYSQSTGGWIMLGILIAMGESAWRLREG